MKVLIANWVYDWGSTGFITRALTDELTREGHQVIVASAQDKGERDPRVRLFSSSSEWRWYWRLHRLGTPRFSGSRNASKRLLQIVEDEKPDVVNLHLLHCNCLDLYYLLRRLGEHNVKTVVTNHAELYYTGNCGHTYECMNWVDKQCKGCPDAKTATGSYLFGNPHRNWKLMKKAFSYFKPENLLFTAVSPWVKDRFYQSPIVKGFDCEVVLNGLDTAQFYLRGESEEIARRIGTTDFLLHVTASFNPALKDDVKGAYYLVKLAEAMPEQTFVVVATSISNADNLPKNVVVWEKVQDRNQLAELYSAARLTVLASRRETFSMVVAESLCCGTPVVGFKAGGPETVAIPDASQFVGQRDVEGLSEAIRIMLEKDFDRKAISVEARQKYSSETMAKNYLRVYQDVLQR